MGQLVACLTLCVDVLMHDRIMGFKIGGPAYIDDRILIFKFGGHACYCFLHIESKLFAYLTACWMRCAVNYFRVVGVLTHNATDQCAWYGNTSWCVRA